MIGSYFFNLIDDVIGEKVSWNFMFGSYRELWLGRGYLGVALEFLILK